MLSAANLEQGHYQLICASLAGFLPTDVSFEVVESTGVEKIIIVDSSASEQDGTVWYDLQGRKLTTKSTTGGIYIVGGKKIMVK